MNMKKSQLFVSIFIAVIMISSIIGFMYSPKEAETLSTTEFNGVKFYQSQNKWVALKDNQQFTFDYSPPELANITLPATYYLNTNKLYIIYNASEQDSSITYLAQKMYTNLGNLGRTISIACISEQDCPDIPIKDCQQPAIYLKKAPDNIMYNYESCLVIAGDNLYQNQAVDKLDQAFIGV